MYFIEFCFILIGHEGKPKSWSKYAPDSSAYKKIHGLYKKEQVDDESRVKENKNVNPVVKELSDKVSFDLSLFEK